MKKLSFLLLLLPACVCAEGPILKSSDTIQQQEFENVYQDIRNGSLRRNTNGDRCVDDPILCVDMSSSVVQVALGTVQNYQATLTASGGSLSSGSTYYYRVYPFSASGKGGWPTPEIMKYITVNGSKVSASWDLLPGASYYRITRGECSGCEAGYFQTTSNSYDDTGGSYTSAGTAWGNGNNLHLSIGGSLTMPAGGGIGWTDPLDGTRRGSLAVTSAGEMEFQTTTGRSESSYYFNDSTGTQRMAFSFDTNPARWYWNQIPWQIRVSTVEFNLQELTSTLIINGTSIELLRFSTNTITANAPLKNTGQPSFSARVNGSSLNVTGNGAAYLLQFGNEEWDLGNNFNVSTFTATVAGKYQFCASVDLEGLTAAHSSRRIDIRQNGTAKITSYNDYSLIEVNRTVQICGNLNVSVGDQITATVAVSGSTQVVDVANDSASGYFQGFLLH